MFNWRLWAGLIIAFVASSVWAIYIKVNHVLFDNITGWFLGAFIVGAVLAIMGILEQSGPAR